MNQICEAHITKTSELLEGAVQNMQQIQATSVGTDTESTCTKK